MLQHLVAEDHVEGGVWVGEGIGICDLKGTVLDVAPACQVLPRPLKNCLDCIHSSDLSLWDELGEICGDGSWAAANVQDGVMGFQVGEEEGGAVLCCASSVAVYYTGMVAVGVNGFFLSSGHFGLIACKLRDKNR